jgi:hypothetical protein
MIVANNKAVCFAAVGVADKELDAAADPMDDWRAGLAGYAWYLKVAETSVSRHT